MKEHLHFGQILDSLLPRSEERIRAQVNLHDSVVQDITANRVAI